MELVQPAIGLIFWMSLAFIIVWFGLGKLAFPAILKSIKERESSIQEALDAAKQAKEDLEKLQSSNEQIIKEARNERDMLLKEAREMRDKLIAEAKMEATDYKERLMTQAKEAIQIEKKAAIADLKIEVAKMSIEIAEKIIGTTLSNEDKQKQLVNDLLKELKFN
jgi:F-type H+-transporting ATPase subunit b